MTWIAAGIGAIGVIGGIAGNNSAKKTARESNKIARDTLNFNKEIYNDYKNKYGGIIDLVIADAEKGVDPDLGRVTSEASADTATAYKNAQQALDNQNQRMGINPNSGRAESSNRQTALSQAITTAGNVTNARNTERTKASEQTWNRRYGVYQQGNSLMSGSASNVANSMSNLANTYSNQATQQSNLSNQAIAGGISSITQGLLNDPNALKNIWGNKTETQPISSMATATKGMKVDGTSAGSGLLYDNISSIRPQLNTNGSFLG